MIFVKLLSTLCIAGCLVQQGLRNVVTVRADVSGASSKKAYQRNPFQRSPLQTNNILTKHGQTFPKQSQIKSTRKPNSFGIRGGSDVDSEDEYKKALMRTVITVSSAGLFGVFLTATRGLSTGYEFIAAYLVEQSLSIDNIFVFIMLFDYFRVPLELQNRVLSWGIIGAVVLRGLMIGVGVAAIQKFKSVILFFAGILIASSVNLLMEKDHGDDEDMDNNIIMKLTKALFPNTSSEFDGEAFFTAAQNGKKVATPLLLCLVCIELSDFVFAVDSIPAVIGVSKDPLVVYASNIFAIMALRSLYTVVAKAVTSMHYLKPAVALVLGFVGAKMIAEYFHFEIGTGTSLAVVCSLLGTGVVASLWQNNMKPEDIKIENPFGDSWSNITVVA